MDRPRNTFAFGPTALRRLKKTKTETPQVGFGCEFSSFASETTEEQLLFALVVPSSARAQVEVDRIANLKTFAPPHPPHLLLSNPPHHHHHLPDQPLFFFFRFSSISVAWHIELDPSSHAYTEVCVCVAKGGVWGAGGEEEISVVERFAARSSLPLPGSTPPPRGPERTCRWT